jgi:hypothetical protein
MKTICQFLYQSLKDMLLRAKSWSALFATGLLLLVIVPRVSGQDNWDFYRQAIKDAAVYNPNKVMPLRPLQAEGGNVRVVTFTNYTYQTGAYQVPAGVYIWVTPEGEVQDICRKFNLKGEALRLRLSQLLGMPPNTTNSNMVVFSMPIKGIFRPTPDPNPTTVYPCAADAMAQCGNTFPPNPSADYVTWFIGQDLGSYKIGQADKDNGYPWTHLGYTYNWTPYAASKYGASEYVIQPNTNGTVLSQTPIDQYCAPVPANSAQKQN